MADELNGPATPLAQEIYALLIAKVGSVERFASGWGWRSHSPRQRAEQALSGAVSMLENGMRLLTAENLSDEQIAAWRDKAISLWLAYEAAGARTANPMITGPANFPVARNRKALDVERKRGEEYYEHVNHPARYIARLKRSADKLVLSTESAETKHRALEFPGVKLVQNAVLDRVQLVFDGKPEAETITSLKGEAFRWSPREGAWQRKNTNNGVQAAYRVLRSLGFTKGTLTGGEA